MSSSSDVIQGFAPGKLILSGEHAVVFGHLAIAIAVDRGTTVTLTARSGPTRIEHADIHDDRLQQAVDALLPAQGLSVGITTNLPVGRGMGSSAALSVALVRADAARQGRIATFDECVERGFIAERIFHGDPSGVDHTVSALGGGVLYRKGQPVQPISPPALRLVVMDTGEAGDTRALVAGVARLPDAVERLDQIGSLTEQIAEMLTEPELDHASLGALLTENHRHLQGVGVSTPGLDALVDAACQAGALGAKLAGAGGGGVAIALIDEDAAPVIEAANRLGCDAFEVGVAPTSDCATQ
ncbi:MAG: mevalonate kinase [Myxococcota bacterium]